MCPSEQTRDGAAALRKAPTRRRGYVLLLLFVALSYPITTVALLAIDAPVNAVNQFIKMSCVGIGALLLAATLMHPVRLQRTLVPMLLFFVIYGLRLVFDVVGAGTLMPFQTPLYVFGYFFGLTFLPVLLMSVAYRAGDIDSVAEWSFKFLVVANLALFAHSALAADWSLAGLFSQRVEVAGDEEGTAVLNPLVFGTVGSMLAATVIGRLCTAAQLRSRDVASAALLFLVGVANVLFSASRGPALALLAAVALLCAALLWQDVRGARSRLHPRSWLLLMLLVGIMAGLVVVLGDTILLIDRFFSMMTERRSGGIEERDLVYNAAWSDFLSSPWWGRSYVVSFESQSPHNIFLEALMATGLLGFAFFATAIGHAFVGLWRLAGGLAGSSGVQIALASTCLLMMGLTSSSIGQTPELWIFLGWITVMSANARSLSTGVRPR